MVLAQYIDSIESGTLVKHDNLRNPDWSLFHDVKHIKKRSIPKFVKNLKQGLRFALDIPPTLRNSNSKRNMPQNMNSNVDTSLLYSGQPRLQGVTIIYRAYRKTQMEICSKTRT